MKTKRSILSIVALLLIAISSVLVSCEKDKTGGVVIYKGQVVYAKTTIPFSNLEVRLTDGSNVNNTVKTDSEGRFSMKVDVSTINGNYYFLVGDASCLPKKVEIPGWGRAEFDLGVIEVEGPSMPIVSTKPVTSIEAGSAVCGGNVESDGRLTVTARGVCYSKKEYPTTSDLHTTEGTGIGEFTSNLTNLEYKTIYYVRAYATNSKGTAYGEQMKFTTESGAAVVETMEVTDVSAKDAVCGGNITSDGGFPITERGLCWSTHQFPTKNDASMSDGAAGLGQFKLAIVNLQPSTTYYVRAYAVNSTTVSYGEQKEFTTTSGLPTLITASTTANSKTIISGGNISSDGGFQITNRGVCYSTINSNPTIADGFVTNGRGTGSYSCTITNISVSTTYYVRSFATNSVGTGYGNVQVVTTGNGLPTVITMDPGENITATSIATGGNVSDDGGYTVMSRGVVYSTLPYPTLENATKVTSGSGVGYFSANITGVTPASNTYYIRAYATNSKGTAYGEQVTITPERSQYLSLPVVEYGGYRYHVYKDMGSMDWNSAMQLCDDLTFAGYDDWFLPDQYELRAIGEARIRGWVVTGSYYNVNYWSSSTYTSTSSYYILLYSDKKGTDVVGVWSSTDYAGKSVIFRVRPVRKDKIQ